MEASRPALPTVRRRREWGQRPTRSSSSLEPHPIFTSRGTGAYLEDVDVPGGIGHGRVQGDVIAGLEHFLSSEAT